MAITDWLFSFRQHSFRQYKLWLTQDIQVLHADTKNLLTVHLKTTQHLKSCGIRITYTEIVLWNKDFYVVICFGCNMPLQHATWFDKPCKSQRRKRNWFTERVLDNTILIFVAWEMNTCEDNDPRNTETWRLPPTEQKCICRRTSFANKRLIYQRGSPTRSRYFPDTLSSQQRKLWRVVVGLWHRSVHKRIDRRCC